MEVNPDPVLVLTVRATIDHRHRVVPPGPRGTLPLPDLSPTAVRLALVPDGCASFSGTLNDPVRPLLRETGAQGSGAPTAARHESWSS